jgi:hypothetical protein
MAQRPKGRGLRFAAAGLEFVEAWTRQGPHTGSQEYGLPLDRKKRSDDVRTIGIVSEERTTDGSRP